MTARYDVAWRWRQSDVIVTPVYFMCGPSPVQRWWIGLHGGRRARLPAAAGGGEWSPTRPATPGDRPSSTQPCRVPRPLPVLDRTVTLATHSRPVQSCPTIRPSVCSLVRPSDSFRSAVGHPAAPVGVTWWNSRRQTCPRSTTAVSREDHTHTQRRRRCAVGPRRR